MLYPLPLPSSFQIVPNIAERARELFVFQRTPCYVVDKVERTYPEWVKVRRASL